MGKRGVPRGEEDRPVNPSREGGPSLLRLGNLPDGGAFKVLMIA
jgi:hypothetical protein